MFIFFASLGLIWALYAALNHWAAYQFSQHQKRKGVKWIAISLFVIPTPAYLFQYALALFILASLSYWPTSRPKPRGGKYRSEN